MYHMTEDREFEAMMDAREQHEGESRADDLSSSSYCDALNEYRGKAETGLLFEAAYSGENPISYGEKLADRLAILEKELHHGIVPAEWLSPDEHTIVFDAFLLPFGFYYNEYTFVGEGGNARFPRDSEDFGRFDEETQWEESDETDTRSKVVEAVYQYCVSAAALAKHLDAKPEMRKIIRAMELIEMNCRDGHDTDGGMSKKEAGLVCGWIEYATRALWGYSTIQARYIKLGFAAIDKAPAPQPTTPELTPEQKRYDELLAKGMAGFITEGEEREMREIMANAGKVYEPYTGPRTNGNDVGSATDDKSGAAAGGNLSQLDIRINDYYKKFVSVDPVKCTISITDDQEVVKTFTIPREYDNGWTIIKWILETPDAQEGWFAFSQDDPQKVYFASRWRPQFLHKEKPIPEMKVFLRYIWSKHGRGRHDGPTELRFQPKQKPILPPKKKSKKSKSSKTQGQKKA